MKLGFLAINFSLIDDDNNVASIEVIKMAELLRQRGVEVDCMCRKSTKYAKAFGEVNINDYDAFLVMSGGIDFIAGKFSENLAANYEFLAKVHQPIFYLFDDLSLPFQQIYKNCCRILEGVNTADLTEEMLAPYKEKYFVSAPAIIVSQGYDLAISKKLHKHSEINIIDHVYNPNNEWLTLTDEPYRENTHKYDLILGGSLRKSKRRQDTYIKYMFGHDKLKAALYGTAVLKRFDKDKIEGLTLPEFLGKKVYSDVIDTNAKGFATLITGDKCYQNNVVTLRLAESILANCVCFIDEVYDKNHVIFPEMSLLYVNTKQDIVKVINALKEDEDLYNIVIEYQHAVYNRMKHNDCMQKLIDIIKPYCNNGGNK